MKCKICGVENPDGAIKCFNCNNLLEKRRHKNVTISAILAIVLPGFGYLYFHQWYRAITFYLIIPLIFINSIITTVLFPALEVLVGHLVTVVMIIYVVLYILQIIDSVKVCQLINQNKISY